MDHRSFPGCTNWEFAGILLKEAKDTNSLVLGDFNGTPMLAHPGGSREEMLENWSAVRAEQQKGLCQ